MGIIDSQSVKTTERGGPHGKDPFKKVNGRKRHLVVDTLGMVVAAAVHSAGIQDRDVRQAGPGEDGRPLPAAGEDPDRRDLQRRDR